MLELVFIVSFSSLLSYFFIWIGNQRLALIPLFFVLIFIIGQLGWFSFSWVSTERLKHQGAKISRWIIIIGMFVLISQQGMVRYHTTILVSLINIILYISSYHRSYSEGKETFLFWIAVSFFSALTYLIFTQQYSTIPYLLTSASFVFLILFTFLPYLLPSLHEKEKKILSQQKELAIYGSVLSVLYWIFLPIYNAIIVAQLAFLTLCIALRQTYLGRSQQLQYEKKEELNGRAILSGQKVLERYDTQKKQFDLNFFNSLLANGYMPSSYGMIFLQYGQITLVWLLILISIWGLFHHGDYILIRYWLGIICFIITVFWIQAQERFVHHYQSIALVIITGSYYITLFDSTGTTSAFARGSLLWLSMNMIVCLFYREIFPSTRYIFSKKDLILRLIMIIIGSVVTLLSLTLLSFSWSILFALWCIILWMTGYFTYHIWKKNIL